MSQTLFRPILLVMLTTWSQLYAQTDIPNSDDYCTRVVLFENMTIDLFTSRMFRARTSDLEGEKFPAKYQIPFAIGKVDPWHPVNFKSREDSLFKYVVTDHLCIRINKSDKSWSVWKNDMTSRIYPSDGPVYGMFKDGYTLFDAASAFDEINNNSRYAHWFYNHETDDYITTYLEKQQLMDRYFIYGPDYLSLFYQLNQLVGPEPLLPKKAYGFLQTQHLACEGTQEKLMEVARQFRERDIPIDNLIVDFEWGDGCDLFREVTWGSRLDWSENYRTPRSPEAMLDALDSMHYDIMLIRHNAPDFPGRSGQGWTETVVDDRVWWESYWLKMKEGVDGAWQDTRQNDVTDSYIWMRTQDALEADKRVLFMGCRKMQSLNPWDFRYSDVPVNQIIGSRRYPFDWTGDASFSWNELRWQIKAITNSHGAMKGITYISSDAVGANWKIQARWNQFSDFSSISRSHNPKPWSGNIDVKNFENKIRITGRDTIEIKQVETSDNLTAENSIRKHRKLRYRLLPYIYSHALENYLTGMPITRPMLLSFPQDYFCNADQWPYQYMFGNSMLVAPVYGDFSTMEIYLPRGFDWIDYWNDTVYPDGGIITYNTTDINTLPLFVKAGAIIPLRQEMNWIDPHTTDSLIFEIYPGDSISSFILYEDDNLSIDYQQGNFSKTPISCQFLSSGNLQLIIDKAEGHYHGMLAKRSIKFKIKQSIISPRKVLLNGMEIPKDTIDSDKINYWYYHRQKDIIEITVYASTGHLNKIEIEY